MLRAEGYDVRIDHLRISQGYRDLLVQDSERRFRDEVLRVAERADSLREKGEPISNCGGVTIAQLYTGETMIAEAVAVCSPLDNFNKKIGRAIATGRALKGVPPAA